MHALVIYESMFGNTRSIAAGVAEGLASTMAVETVEVGAAPTSVGSQVDLLVVGGPTHAFSLSRDSSRAEAAKLTESPLVSEGDGLREWLEQVSVEHPVAATAFDTHVQLRLPGSAAKAATKRLRRLGARIVTPPVSFYVADRLGPLLPDECARARTWGRDVAGQLATPIEA